MKNFFSIIGGMGTLATEAYVHLLNTRVKNITCDQDYMDYILVNDASTPDRTTWIEDHSRPNPYDTLKENVEKQALLGPDFYVMPCNTAHYWYDQLNALNDIPFLNMMDIAVHKCVEEHPDEQKIGLIATAGSVKDGLYVKYIERMHRNVELGGPEIQPMVNQLIYGDIKDKGDVDEELFHKILKTMHDKYGCNVVILGCTELSLCYEDDTNIPVSVIDPQGIIADVAIELETEIRQGTSPKDACKKYLYDD